MGGAAEWFPMVRSRAVRARRRWSVRRWRRVAGLLGLWVAGTALLTLGEAVGRWNHLGAGVIFAIAGAVLITQRAWDGWAALFAALLVTAAGFGWPGHSGAVAVWINFTAGVVPALAAVTASLAGDVPWLGPPGRGR